MKALIAAVLMAVGISLAAGYALANNPHGSKSDPNASCGHHSGTGKPSGQCNDKGLPQSNGCNPNSSPHNPHCQGGETTTTTTPVTPSTPSAPVEPGTTPKAQKAAKRAEAVAHSSGNESLQVAQLGG